MIDSGIIYSVGDMFAYPKYAEVDEGDNPLVVGVFNGRVSVDDDGTAQLWLTDITGECFGSDAGHSAKDLVNLSDDEIAELLKCR